jgi:D-tyrosyl-tRNA(Tyr) deacylase
MIGLIQRVTSASVTVDGKIVGEIGKGILLFLGVEKKDNEAIGKRLFHRISHYRIFEDESGRMNHSLLDIGGELLIVPQFTLAADTKKGMRPSFTPAAAPDLGEALFKNFIIQANEVVEQVQTGIFATDMQVALVNDGPATFTLTVQ